MLKTQTSSPFHRGEREIQARLGVREKIENVGQRFIRDHLPDEHREFYAQLPFLLIGSLDKSGRPWASVLVGRPGLVDSPDPRSLNINTRRIFGDPLNDNLTEGLPIGILGIEYQSRRRNRMSGKISAFTDDRMEIKINQSFGNCPQYIQARGFQLLPGIDSVGDMRPKRVLDRLDERAREIISKADNFYIATHFSDNSDDTSQGTDVSHRGGKPGFVRVDNERQLTFPDFVGNYHFNTIGNLLLNPRAGLLFIDFNNGDLLYLTCTAEITWDSDERNAFAGAERLVRFTLDEGVLVENAVPIRWNFLEYSPSIETTGSWQDVADKIAARERGNVYRNFKVVRVEPESETITSFYLEPEDGNPICCHKAGQFLPVEIKPPSVNEPIQRTYTISNAPNGSYYRLSIKREPPSKPDMPAGLSSNYFHDHVTAGSLVRAMSPRGHFIMEESSTRPVVLISGGVGVTPMVSMLEQLGTERSGCGCTRQVWFVHAARNGQAQAFSKQVRKLAENWPCVSVHFRFSQPSVKDVEGQDYDSVGYVDIELLKSLLPLDDYEFYLCGPAPFMESLYDGLKSLNIIDERIHYEFFGRGAAFHQQRPRRLENPISDVGKRMPVPVQFARSDIETLWDPSKGTLLELAESEGLQPAYSCRSGICQTCATQIMSGDVDYIDPPMATPGEGSALICCSYPRAKPNENTASLVLDL